MENSLGNKTPIITLDGSNPENMEDQYLGEKKLINIDAS